MRTDRSRQSRLTGRLTLVGALAALVIGLAGSAFAAAVHIGLASSVPAKGAHLMTAPTEIRLTFTEQVDVTKASVELLGPKAAPIALDSLRAVVDSNRVAVAKIAGKLTGGSYTVKWKAVSPDGEAASGSFGFMFMPH